MTDTVKYSYKYIWNVAYPILISLAMEQLIGMTDTAFLGRVGEIELGASAIAGVYYMAIFMAGFGFSVGSQIIIARRNGEGRYRDIGTIFYHGIYFLATFAILIIIASELFSPWLLDRIVSSPEIGTAAMDYVRWRLIGLIFAFTTTVFRAFYVGTTQTKTLTLNSVVMVLSNVIFNYILIFGKLGLPALGIAGAAIGSTLAELVSLIFFIVYTARKTDCRKYGLDKPTGFRWKELGSIFSVSVWTMVQNFLSLSTWFIFFMFIEHLGERSLAISNIVRNVSSIVWMVVAAFGSTCSSLVSNAIGQGHKAAVPKIIMRVIKMTYALALVILILISVFPHSVIRIYTDIPGLISATVPSLLVLCSSYLINIPAMICFQSISGTGNTRTAFALEMVTLCFYVLFCVTVINGIRPDVAVCWFSEHVYALIMLVLCGGYLYTGKWKNKRI